MRRIGMTIQGTVMYLLLEMLSNFMRPMTLPVGFCRAETMFSPQMWNSSKHLSLGISCLHLSLPKRADIGTPLPLGQRYPSPNRLWPSSVVSTWKPHPKRLVEPHDKSSETVAGVFFPYIFLKCKCDEVNSCLWSLNISSLPSDWSPSSSIVSSMRLANTYQSL